MKKLTIILPALFLFAVSCANDDSVQAMENVDFAQEVFQEVNDYRSSLSLPALQ